MFATVEFYERDNRVKSRMKRLMGKSEIVTERVSLSENEYFYKIRVPVHKNKYPVSKLRRVASGVNDGLLFPEGFTDEVGVKVYRSSFFREILLFNSAVSLLEKGGYDPSVTLITLIDKKGFLSSQTERLIPLAGEIRVVTDNVRAYERTAGRVMEEYGLSLLVSDKLSSIPERGIIISFKSNVIPVYFKGLLITGEKRLLPFAKVLTGTGIKAEEKYMSLCPSGIDMTDFLSALCEVCFQKELRKSEYENLVDISV